MRVCVHSRVLAALWLLAAPALAGLRPQSELDAGYGRPRVARDVITAGPPPAKGPRFAAAQELAVVAAAGQEAALHCRVLALADKAVSWVRSRDLQILTHAGAVFTADSRVSASRGGVGAAGVAGAGGSEHVLRIARLREADSGRYECQVNTEPKLSLFFNLTVVDEAVPRVEVAAAARLVRGAVGGAVTLQCDARYEPAPRSLPTPALALRWSRDGAALRRDGGVALDAERTAGRARSRLTLPGLSRADAGRYECAALAFPPGSGPDLQDVITLIVEDEEGDGETMQRDQWTSGAPSLDHCWCVAHSWAAGLLLAAALLR